MKLTKAQKKVKADEFAPVLKASSCVCFTQYQGLKFTDLYSLRAKLKPLGGSYKVVKNSLIKHALSNAGMAPGDPQLFKGPIGVVTSKGGDASAIAKVLVAFAKENPSLKFRAVFVPPTWMPGTDVAKLATLPTKGELYGKLAGALYSSVAQIAAVLQAPTRDLVYVLKALEEEKAKSGGAPATAA